MLGCPKKYLPSSREVVWRTPLSGYGRPLFYLENSLLGREGTRPEPEIFLYARNDQQIRGLESQRKKGWRNAVQSPVLGELIFDRDMLTTLALKEDSTVSLNSFQ